MNNLVTRLYLASTSPARLATLRAAGIEPWLISPDVDESAAAAEESTRLGRSLTTPEMVQFLAKTKGQAALNALPAKEIRGLIFGGDSAFEIDGTTFGKPHTPEVAKQRILQQRGRTGVLYSGHWLIDARDPENIREVGAVSSATVTMASDFSETEIDDYIATGEPLFVAGGFTIDGLGSAFIERIEGDPTTVIGLSVLTLRRLVNQLDIPWSSLWNKSQPS